MAQTQVRMTDTRAAQGRVDDAEVMRIWRECGLPEYFLGNGGSNHKLVAFAKACAEQSADEIEKLRAQVVSLQSSLDAGPPRPGKKTPDALKEE
jgi:hypothetical protein